MQNPFDPDDSDKFSAIVRRLPGVDEATITDYATDAWARAVEAAPQIVGFDDDSQEAGAVKAILRSVILRWHDSGTKTGVVAGPYQIQMAPGDQTSRGYRLTSSEVLDLQQVGIDDDAGVWSFNTGAQAQPALPQHVLNGSTGP
ncbi:Uncharacterised protein [Mycobacteroides abscessus subsp. massiliense]|uniref:hypothetical protein n=1 Tax=Mycobacteroides abscessus TaxID=36809 RepID=UPI0009A5DDC3|nr:hypothetical protein [Mycobacteroides abscessus]SLH43759.1 Uncharacterised protein [Mycobacteroides abscessus subsp. massiliense]